MQTRVAQVRDELIDNPAMQRWIDGLWEQGRASLLRAARDPEAATAGRFGEALRQLGGTLQSDQRLRVMINRFARRTAVDATASYGDGIDKLVSETVRGWDEKTVNGRLETAVGSELQFTRVHGKIEGGKAGEEEGGARGGTEGKIQ